MHFMLFKYISYSKNNCLNEIIFISLSSLKYILSYVFDLFFNNRVAIAINILRYRVRVCILYQNMTSVNIKWYFDRT